MRNDNHQDGFNLSDLRAAMSEEDRVGLVNALKDKLQSLAGKHTDVLETLSAAVRKRVEVLREIQNQHDELEAKFFEERAVLEAKYQKLYEPLYTKRYEIVNGVVEVDGIKNESSVETLAEDKASEEKGVPDFWLTALKTNEVLAEEIQERDEEALKYLKDIKWCRIDNPKGFKLEFFFNSNPYFKNSVLTKTYHMIDEHEPILEKAIGTDIEWFPGKCVTQKIVKKKPKKGSKNAKPITKTEDCESFFNFFNPPEVPDDDADIDEETAEQLQSQMELDYDIGSTIRDKIIPHAVSWFTGEAVQDDDAEIEDDEDGEDEEDEDEDEDEDDEDEDDEDEDEEENGKSKKKVCLIRARSCFLFASFTLGLLDTDLCSYYSLYHQNAVGYKAEEEWRGASRPARRVQTTVKCSITCFIMDEVSSSVCSCGGSLQSFLIFHLNSV
nr:PREDICTED: nucleosome assembly protein 1;4-like isoform X1 [Musa acuminata subsp. malaccensis]